MPVSNPLIFWTRDGAETVNGPQALVLLADLDDPAIRDLASVAPTSEDLSRAEAYRGAAKEAFLARRALLRELIARRLGAAAEAIVIVADAAGAPHLASPSLDQDLYLSISRRGALAALAIAPRPIGVDIEILGASKELPVAMLHKNEAGRLAGSDSAARHKAFLEIWTFKEAYLKATRTGLLREPAEIEVCLAEHLEDTKIRLFDRDRPVATAACDYRCERFGGETVIAACVVL